MFYFLVSVTPGLKQPWARISKRLRRSDLKPQTSLPRCWYCLTDVSASKWNSKYPPTAVGWDSGLFMQSLEPLNRSRESFFEIRACLEAEFFERTARV